MAAFTMLALLAVTSNRWMISRLGVWWKRLHKLIYLISVLVVVHLTWLTKSEYMEAFLYGLAIAVLLAFRAARLGWIHHRMPVAGR
jgi:sulfoxide reductase heme-binding subunit YedZ